MDNFWSVKMCYGNYWIIKFDSLIIKNCILISVVIGVTFESRNSSLGFNMWNCCSLTYGIFNQNVASLHTGDTGGVRVVVVNDVDGVVDGLIFKLFSPPKVLVKYSNRSPLSSSDWTQYMLVLLFITFIAFFKTIK